MIFVAGFTPIRLYISYKDKKADIKLAFGNIKFNIPIKEKKKNSESKSQEKTEKKDAFEKFKIFCAILQAFYDTSDSLRKTIIIERLKLDAVFGTGDAAFTGMAVGFSYAEIYKLAAFISEIFTVYPPKITITPNFGEEFIFSAEAESIIKTKAAHIISTAWKFYKNYRKELKGKD